MICYTNIVARRWRIVKQKYSKQTFFRNCQKNLDLLQNYWYNIKVGCQMTPTYTWRCIEVVITSTIGNRVAVMSGTRVRIPPSPPEKNPLLSTDKRGFFSTKCAVRHDKHTFGAWSAAAHREAPIGVSGTLNFTSCDSTILHSGIAAASLRCSQNFAYNCK